MLKRKNSFPSLQAPKLTFRRDSGAFVGNVIKRKASTYAMGAIAKKALNLVPYVGQAVQAYDTAKMIKNVVYPNMKKSAFTTGNSVGGRAASKKVLKKKKLVGTKKTIKVPSKLKKQIVQTLKSEDVNGHYSALSYGYLDRPTDCSQAVQGIQQAVGYNDYSGGWSFLPEDFLHAASILWNNKLDSQTSRPVLGFGNLGIDPVVSVPGKLTTCVDTEFTVKNSYEGYLLRNNTQQTVSIIAYECSPKQPSILNLTTVTAAGGTIGTQYLGDREPQDAWGLALGAGSSMNVSNSDRFQLGMLPEKCPQWTQSWNYKKTEIVLEAGQSTYLRIQGPKNFNMDFKKFYKNDLFMAVQKFSTYTMFVTKTDLLNGRGDAKGQVGRFKINGVDGNIIIERSRCYKLSMPETVGTKLQTGFVTQAANFRKPGFAHYVYANVTPASLVRVDEEQPATQIF